MCWFDKKKTTNIFFLNPSFIRTCLEPDWEPVEWEQSGIGPLLEIVRFVGLSWVAFEACHP